MQRNLKNLVTEWFHPQVDDQGRQHVKIQSAMLAVERFLHSYGWLVLIAFAFCYYGQYYRTGLNLGGEGGTAAVYAMRLMEGQRPIADTFLGYNVLWFYPIVWMFELTGPNYVALRIYFFAICTMGAVLGYLALRRNTGSGLYSLLVASLLVLMPGMIFRNYMPFQGLLNMYVLSQAYVFTQPSWRWTVFWQAMAGLALGVTFLLRIELGIFFSIINLGLAVLYPFGFRKQFFTRLPLAVSGIVLAAVMVWVTHAPVFADARARGFDKELWGQYGMWLGFLGFGIKQQVLDVVPTAASEPVPTAIPATAEPPSPVVPAEPSPIAYSQEGVDRNGLMRVPLGDIGAQPSFYDQAYVIITYLPILCTGIILVLGSGVLLWSLVTFRAEVREISLAILTCLGASLTLFPQFFFFRPDTPHLSEFMAPFLVALGCATWHSVRVGWTWPSRIDKVVLFSAVGLFVINAALYTYHTMPKESGGTIGKAKKKKYEFVAENGVRVLLGSKEKEERQGVYDAVMKYTKPDDYIVCYPYAPTINFMTNRRSYEYNLYADNATETHTFYDETVAELNKYRPAVIVIDNRDINKSDSSRFSTWAASTYEYILTHYRAEGKFGRQEVYVRPDLVGDLH